MISSACRLSDAYAASTHSITILPSMDDPPWARAEAATRRFPPLRTRVGDAASAAPSAPLLQRLARFLEIARPVLHETVQRLLGRALVRDDVVVDALLHVEQQRRVDGLGPEVLHHVHGLEKVAGERRALR